jgi:multidrug efflux pump subunit AcrB
VAKDSAARDALMTRLRQAFADGFDEVMGRVNPLEMGPPVGWPIKYRVSGDDAQEVRRLSYRMADIIAANPHATLVNYDWNETARAVRIEVNQDKARLLGVSSESLSRSINAVVTGRTVTQIRDSIYLIDVVARAAADERANLDTLRDLKITLDNGVSIPLGDVADLDYGLDEPFVWRRGTLPTITVQADVVGSTQAATVVKELASQVAALRAAAPPGYTIEVGGTVEESAKGQESVAAGLPMMAILMVTLLMIQLQSMQRTFLVISVAPLGLIGVVAAMVPTHTPMGFIAILGLIALTGMIIRNSVILIVQIDTHIAEGQHPWDAVIDATLHRTRPIMLTAMAAILGMIPIAREVFWGPMAYVIIGGLVSATLLTLFFLPALFVVWFRIREPQETLTGAEPKPKAPVSLDSAEAAS